MEQLVKHTKQLNVIMYKVSLIRISDQWKANSETVLPGESEGVDILKKN